MSNPVITELTDLMNTGGIPDYIFKVLAASATEINRLDERVRQAEAGERSADMEVERLNKVVKGLHGDLESVVGLRDLVDDIKATLILKNDDEIIPDLDRMIEKERAPRDNRNPNTYEELVEHYQLARDRLDELYGMLKTATHGRAKAQIAQLLGRINQIGDFESKYKTLFDENQESSRTLLRIQQILGMKGSNSDELISLIVDLQFRTDLTKRLQEIQSIDDELIHLEIYSDGSGAVYGGEMQLFSFDNEAQMWSEYTYYVEEEV